MKKINEFAYPLFVTYIENGVECIDCWSLDTLNTELNRDEVKIVNVELMYNVQMKLGLVEEF